jgi:hypothetical protein
METCKDRNMYICVYIYTILHIYICLDVFISLYTYVHIYPFIMSYKKSVLTIVLLFCQIVCSTIKDIHLYAFLYLCSCLVTHYLFHSFQSYVHLEQYTYIYIYIHNDIYIYIYI